MKQTEGTCYKVQLYPSTGADEYTLYYALDMTSTGGGGEIEANIHFCVRNDVTL